MTRRYVNKILQNILSCQKEVGCEVISSAKHVKTDLGLDSIDVALFVIDAEQALHVKLDDAKIALVINEDWDSVVNYICGRVPADRW